MFSHEMARTNTRLDLGFPQKLSHTPTLQDGSPAEGIHSCTVYIALRNCSGFGYRAVCMRRQLPYDANPKYREPSVFLKSITSQRSRMQKSISFRTLERGRFHVIVRQTVPSLGSSPKWPILYLTLPQSQGNRVTRYDPLLDFYEDHSSRSYGWMKNAARSIGLLVDYALSSEIASPHPNENTFEPKFVRGLARALLDGTVQIGEDGRAFDPTSLYWTPLGKRQANVLLSALTWHFLWLKRAGKAARWVEAVSTDETAKDPAVSLRMAFDLLKRRETSLLGHVKSAKRAPPHAFPHVVKPPSTSSGSVPTFPTKYLAAFLHRGFTNRSGRTDTTARLLTHLIFGLGLRKSEVFHLYVTDVQFIRGEPWIFLHHPQYGQIVDNNRLAFSRAEFLQRFGVTPRTFPGGPFTVGWKGMSDDERGTPGYWLPIEPLRSRTAMLLTEYLYEIRPRLMAARPKSANTHPFLLVGRGSNHTLPGDPYTMSAFKEAWRAAVARIGVEFDDPDLARPSKSLGTTPHGARHFYGRFLYTAGVDGEVIRQCMHHRSIEAHKVYTRLTPTEINSIIESAADGTSPPDPYRPLREAFLRQL